MIIPLYKPLGESTHQLAKKLGMLYKTKATHTGTLDPLAEGVVVGLTDLDRFHKSQYANTQKKYFFKIVCGFSTDSDDLLGLVTSLQINRKNIFSNFSKAAHSIIGEHTQYIHPFSAKRINGTSYFSLSGQGIHPPIVEEKIEIFALEILSKDGISIADFHQDIKRKIPLVKGEFRQEAVLGGWKVALQKIPANTKLTTISCQITCSKRTYIRSLVKYLAKEIDQPMVLSQLIRTQNGPYTMADCICLI